MKHRDRQKAEKLKSTGTLLKAAGALRLPKQVQQQFDLQYQHGAGAPRESKSSDSSSARKAFGNNNHNNSNHNNGTPPRGGVGGSLLPSSAGPLPLRSSSPIEDFRREKASPLTDYERMFPTSDTTKAQQYEEFLRSARDAQQV